MFEEGLVLLVCTWHVIIVECVMNNEWFYTGYALNVTSPSLMAVTVYAHLQLQQPYTFQFLRSGLEDYLLSMARMCSVTMS